MSMQRKKAQNPLLLQHRQAAESPIDKAARVLDHLVDAMAGEPSVPLRRVMVLIDIARNPGTSQTAILERLKLEKSTITRSIDWLYNYGCVTRGANPSNARETALTICGFARTHLHHAATLLGNDLARLQSFVDGYITFFEDYRATLRDAKIVTVLTAKGEATRQNVFDELYNGPATTDARALLALIEQGFVETNGT
jgi:DNA-binding MarR family transcriptional regulator